MGKISSAFVAVSVLGFWLSAPTCADVTALEYLYLSEIPEQAAERVQQSITHVRNDEPDAALAVAETNLESEHAEPSPDPLLLSKLLINLGITQVAVGRYEQGRASIERGLEQIQLNSGELNPVLVNGYLAKGISEMAVGESANAKDSFHQAQHIIHRTDGVFSPQQEDLLYHLTMLELALGNPEDADRLQYFSLMIAEHTFGHDSEQVVPVLLRLGAYFSARGSMFRIVSLGELRPMHSFLNPMCRPSIWQRSRPCNPGLESLQGHQLIKSREASSMRTERENMFNTSFEMYERAIVLQRRSAGGGETSLAQMHRSLANAHVLHGDFRAAKRVLQESVAIEETSQHSNLEDRVGALLDLGDLLMAQSDGDAAALYLQAWHLQQEKNSNNLLFATPVRLRPNRYRALELDSVPAESAGENGYFALVSYDVSEQGRVENIVVDESNVPGLQLRSIRAEMKHARFRPRIVDGQFVKTPKMRIRFTYLVPETLSAAQQPEAGSL